jgi:hypothetical protein
LVYVANFGDSTISSYAINRDGEIELAEEGRCVDTARRSRHPRLAPSRAVPSTVAGLAAS